MKRVIQERIKRPLADDLLFGDLSVGGEVLVDVAEEGGLSITTRRKEEGQKALPASTP
jgi:ATP-dependent Clp protease ATP-binding subunit ClpA